MTTATVTPTLHAPAARRPHPTLSPSHGAAAAPLAPPAIPPDAMTADDLERHLLGSFPEVQTRDHCGYRFFFAGPGHHLPFASLAASDNPYDEVSDLGRPGVFRVNFALAPTTFEALFPAGSGDIGGIDYTVLDQFLPHPHYARQHFACILNPGGQNGDLLKAYLAEAHALAGRRLAAKDPTGSQLQ